MEHQFLGKAFEWVEHPTGEGILKADEYCPTRDVFQKKIEI